MVFVDMDAGSFCYANRDVDCNVKYYDRFFVYDDRAFYAIDFFYLALAYAIIYEHINCFHG